MKNSSDMRGAACRCTSSMVWCSLREIYRADEFEKENNIHRSFASFYSSSRRIPQKISVGCSSGSFYNSYFPIYPIPRLNLLSRKRREKRTNKYPGRLRISNEQIVWRFARVSWPRWINTLEEENVNFILLIFHFESNLMKKKRKQRRSNDLYWQRLTAIVLTFAKESQLEKKWNSSFSDVEMVDWEEEEKDHRCVKVWNELQRKMLRYFQIARLLVWVDQIRFLDEVRILHFSNDELSVIAALYLYFKAFSP